MCAACDAPLPRGGETRPRHPAIALDRAGHRRPVTDAGTIRLPDLATHRADGTSTIANAVSDDGRTIAGQSDDASGTIKPVVWRCH
jgi:hypothetical protein